MTSTKPIASMSGRQRKLLNAALEIARAEGCCVKRAAVSTDSNGHLRVHIKAPGGKPIRFGVASSPKNADNERNHLKRRLRKALHRADAR